MVDVPAGSRLVLRLDDNVDSGQSAGMRFGASLQGALLDASGNVVVPAGTKVLGVVTQSKTAGNVAGRSEVEIAFTDMQINGVLFPIQSQSVQAVGQGSGRDTARKVGAAALIGGAFGGGSGAAKGAAIGGAAAILTRGKNIKIPSGTMLELSLAAPARVPAPAAPAPVAAAPGAAPAPATPASSGDAQKACVQKLMANGFSADEALSSCKQSQ
jgi:hypothetical protein